MLSNKYIKFKGDYSQLKNLGFSFQKLYANNYMQWEKDGVRIFKKGSELTIGRISNFEGEFLYKFLLVFENTDIDIILNSNQSPIRLFIDYENIYDDCVFFNKSFDTSRSEVKSAHVALMDKTFPINKDGLCESEIIERENERLEKCLNEGIVGPSSVSLDFSVLSVLVDFIRRDWIEVAEY